MQSYVVRTEENVEDDIPDIEDFDQDNLVDEEEDPAALRPSKSKQDGLMRCRTYDLFITYDKYYQTPRMWLSGYDEVLLNQELYGR